MSLHTVDDLMTRDVAVIRSDADVHELEQKLLRDAIHGMPVVDEDNTLVGVVSQTDLIAWHYFSGVDGSSYYQDDSPMPSKESYFGSPRASTSSSRRTKRLQPRRARKMRVRSGSGKRRRLSEVSSRLRNDGAQRQAPQARVSARAGHIRQLQVFGGNDDVRTTIAWVFAVRRRRIGEQHFIDSLLPEALSDIEVVVPPSGLELPCSQALTVHAQRNGDGMLKLERGVNRKVEVSRLRHGKQQPGSFSATEAEGTSAVTLWL